MGNHDLMIIDKLLTCATAPPAPRPLARTVRQMGSKALGQALERVGTHCRSFRL